MIAKFINKTGDKIMEVENSKEGAIFYISDNGDESIAQQIIVPNEEIENLIKFLSKK